MDAGEYPEDEELEKIKSWPLGDWASLLEYVRQIWKYSDCGYWKQDGKKYQISTGGWSGNEDLLFAMKSNVVFWASCWQSSKRGGHYEFELRGK